MDDFVIEHARNSKDGPIDAVRARTQGTYTKYRGHGLFQREKSIFRQENTRVNVEASVSAGVVLVHDERRDISISVSITEMAAILNEALRVGMTKAL
jgi:hypothetical protein|nr:MAG TPA: hypothetical protein [Caudoviricetes sp.]